MKLNRARRKLMPWYRFLRRLPDDSIVSRGYDKAWNRYADAYNNARLRAATTPEETTQP